MRRAVFVTNDTVIEVTDQIDAYENAGDEFAELDDPQCDDPGGHLFLTPCGEVKCKHCGLVVA
jgi:hypothetical protein